MSLRSRRALYVLGAALVADGATFLLDSTGQLRLWSGPGAPRWYSRAMSFFGRHLGLSRALALAEVAGGIAVVRTCAR